MQQTFRQARTSSVIAQELGVSRSRVEYILSTRFHIKPIGRAGLTRLYSPQATAMVRHELNAIDARRASKEADRA